MGEARALRPFKEASLALFSAGAPPQVVADKFHQAVSRGTVYRWYWSWCDMKGIPLEHRYRARKKNDPRHVYEYERQMKEIAKEKRRKMSERRARIARNRAEYEANREKYDNEVLMSAMPNEEPQNECQQPA